jgi:uncharacterized protein YciI
MPGKLFAVLNTRGPQWNSDLPMDDQAEWRQHADFMNGLVAEGVVVLGGPLVGTPNVLLIVRAENETEVEARLAADVWRRNGLLRTRQIVPWWLRLGAWATLDGRQGDNHVDGTSGEQEAPSCKARNATLSRACSTV